MEHPETIAVSPLSGRRVIVCGAGLAGLSFVVSMKTLWTEEMGKPPVIILYEREHGQPDLRREGYSISIRSGGNSLGMQALQRMGLLEQVIDSGTVRHKDETDYRGIWSLDWQPFISLRRPAKADLPRSPMRIARTKLRLILLQALLSHGESVSWGTAGTSFVRTEEGGIRLSLSNGDVDSCDVLVVADGATSKLRTCIRPDDRLSFAGPVSISAVSRFASRPPQPTDSDWGTIPSGTGVSLFAAPMGMHTVNWCISYMSRVPRKPCQQPMPDLTSKAILEEAKCLGSVFNEPFNTLWEHSDKNTLMVFNAMDKKPFAHTIANGVPEGVVFIGDSNHAVSAWSANGANMALIDGYELAEFFCFQPTIDQAIKEYDKRSIPRATASLKGAHDYISIVHSSGLRWMYHYSRLLIYGAFMKIWYEFEDFFQHLRSIISSQAFMPLA